MITTEGKSRPNILTVSWTMVLEFAPRFAFMTGNWNHTYKSLTKTGECVISVPTIELSKQAVQIGTCSGKDVNKFKKFKLTPLPASKVGAPLIKECYANIECRVIDHIKKHNIFVVDAVAAWINEKQKSPKFFHAVGDGRFVIDGKVINHRRIMAGKLPEGV